MAQAATTITRKDWGRTPDGRNVELITLANEAGYRAEVSAYGASLVSLKVPAASGDSRTLIDVVLGYDSLEEYLSDSLYMGSVVGRVANRVDQGRFILGDQDVRLSQNQGGNHLHGGYRGLSHAVWEVLCADNGADGAVVFGLKSADGDEGYPGNADVSVRYELMGNGLRVTFEGSVDARSVLNMAHHPYFHLNGGKGSCLNHQLTLFASSFLPLKEGQIPTGEKRSAAGTCMDFQVGKILGQDILLGDEQLNLAHGYDHFFPLDESDDAGADDLRCAAVLTSRESGLSMVVWTSAPGVHLYTGNFIPQGTQGKAGTVYGPGSGVCLEAQGYPDAPNHSSFESVEVFPNQVYSQITEYRYFHR